MARFFDRRLLQQAHTERLGLALTVALGALGAAATVGQAFALSRAVDGVFLGGRDLAAVWPWLRGLLALTVLRAGASWGAEIAAGRVAARVKSALRERLLRHILSRGPAYIQGEQTGELVNTAVEGVEALDAYFSQYLPQVALAGLVPLIFLAFVFPADPLSGLVLLVTAPLIPLFMMLIGSVADALTRRQWSELSRMSAHFLDVLQGLTTLKLFGRSREQIAVIRQITDRHRDATLRVLRVAFLSALVLEMVGTISTAIVAVEIGLRLLYGKMAFQQAFFVLILAPEFYLPLRLLGTRFHAGIAGVTAGRRIFEVLDAGAEEARLPADHSSPYSAPAPARVRVRLCDVSYSYPGRDRPALDRVSLEIGPGEKVALIGPVGAGKSTIAALLLGFIRPTTGRIEWTWADGRPAAAPDGRPAIAWVPQAPYLFHASVADNIRLGRPEATFAEVQRAAIAARADGFIRNLPQGYDTLIGERGNRLSAGQAQRIALARAFLLDAALVILDEPTAHLDADTEAEVQAAIERLLEGRSALIIAHRLNTVRHADRVVLLDGGRVVEDAARSPCPFAGMGEADASPPSSQGGGVGATPICVNLTSTVAPVLAPVEDPSPGPSPTRGGEAPTPDPSPNFGGGEDCFPFPCREGGRGVRSFPRREGGRGGRWPSPPFKLTHMGTPPSSQGGGRGVGTPGGGRGAGAVGLRLLGFLAPSWPWVALSILLGFLTVASSIGLLATSAWIIAMAALQPSVAVLQVAIVGVRFFGISRGLFRYAERLVSHQVTFRVLARIRTWFYAAIEPLAPARLADRHSGDLLSRIVADIGTLEHFFIRAVAPPIIALLTILLVAVLLGSYADRLIWPAVSLLLFTGFAAPWFTLALARGPGRQLAEQRAALNARLVDGIQGAADLVALRAAGRAVAAVRDLSDALGRTQIQLAGLSGFSTALGIFCTWLAVTAVLATAIPLVAAGRLAGVDLAVLALATGAGFEAVLPLPLAAQYLASSLAAGRRLCELADGETRVPGAEMPEERAAPSVLTGPGEAGSAMVLRTREAAARPWAAGSRPPAVHFRNIVLRYAPDRPPALAGVTLDVPAGSTVAVVGPSAAGKTSLINALLRFWEYEAGEIIIDGQEIRTLEAEAVRSLCGVVAHDPHLFNMTVRDNLRLARPTATPAEIEAAARAAGIHEFIASLPQGYDTWLGEGGARLSGGQRQKLALARAVLKDAPLLILDEPTAHLDAQAEQEIAAGLKRIATSRTTIIITHRPLFARVADQVVVIADGRTLDRGRHAELLARCRLYRELMEDAEAPRYAPPPIGG